MTAAISRYNRDTRHLPLTLAAFIKRRGGFCKAPIAEQQCAGLSLPKSASALRQNSREAAMLRRGAFLVALSFSAFWAAGPARAADFKPVTAETLLNPDPADWLMINRTYDEQRFSPLKEINRSNVGELRMAWTRGMPPGTQESTPMVHDGVMYVIAPGGGVQALDGTSGD